MEKAAPQAKILQIHNEKGGKLALQAKILQYELSFSWPRYTLLIFVEIPPSWFHSFMIFIKPQIAPCRFIPS